MKIERRNSTIKTENTGNTLSGYAAIWDSPTVVSESNRTFTEIVRRNSFNNFIQSGEDLICCFDHEPTLLLGRLSSRTLQLVEDEIGLKYTVELPDTTVGRDVKTLCQRGDLSGSSFAFIAKRDAWNKNTREILEARLYDVSPVVNPCYVTTVGTLNLRSKIQLCKLKLQLQEKKYQY